MRKPLKYPVFASAPDFHTLQDADLSVCYWPAFLTAEQAQLMFERLIRTIDWQQGEIRIFGKVHPEPRLSAWYGDPQAAYRYSSKRMLPLPWTPELFQLKGQLESARVGRFNGVLLNLYRDGEDYMGYHADNEPELGPEPIIASLSLGAERRFLLKQRQTGQKHTLLLESGSLLVMSGPTQQHWLHSLPKARRVKEPRINLTFRTIQPW